MYWIFKLFSGVWLIDYKLLGTKSFLLAEILDYKCFASKILLQGNSLFQRDLRGKTSQSRYGKINEREISRGGEVLTYLRKPGV